MATTITRSIAGPAGTKFLKVLGVVVGVGAVIFLIYWFVNRESKTVPAAPAPTSRISQAPVASEEDDEVIESRQITVDEAIEQLSETANEPVAIIR